MKYKIFAAIIFVTETERRAVMEMLRWTPFCLEGSDNVWFKSTIKHNGISETVIAAQTEEKGNSASAALTSELIHRFRPQYLFMVGIAAGLSFLHKQNQSRYCDVVLADRVWNIAKGKIVDSDSSAIPLDEEQAFIPRPVVHKIDNVFRNKLKTYIKQWNSDIRVHIGAYASGSVVVANAKTICDNVLPLIEKTKALDMESYGVVFSALHSTMPRPQPIVIKGISDFADRDKSDEYQLKAAANSCSLAKYLLSVLPRQEERQSMQNKLLLSLVLNKVDMDHFTAAKPGRIVLFSFIINVIVVVLLLLLEIPVLALGIAAAGIMGLGLVCYIALKRSNEFFGSKLIIECERTEQNTRLQAAGDLRRQLLLRKEVGGLDIGGHIVSGKYLGTDMYSWYCPDGKNLWIYCSDVSGTDINAAMFSSRVTTTLRSLARTTTDIASIVQLSNQLLCETNPEHQTASVLFGVLNLETQVLEYVNAGNEVHFLKKADGAIMQFGVSANSALGLSPKAAFAAQKIKLSKGDLLLFCSAGVTGIRNHDGEAFGAWRVERYLSTVTDDTANDIIVGLGEDVKMFTENENREWEFTIVAVRL